MLASSFALYGLLRKTLDIDAISALFIESLLMLPVALWYWWQQADSSATNLLANAWTLNLWLAAAGVITTVPLLCFIGGARRLQLSTMGFFQYIGPSFMFVFSVWLFGGTLAVYSADALRHSRGQPRLTRRRRAPPQWLPAPMPRASRPAHRALENGDGENR